ncbi:GMP synthase (glutamine-hydrolysing) [Roseovarius nanhaiticus]|uniref:GMP synthase (Glutamine-hydrolysing) n=1 Tax=Roseovarius nanhaiticus TaxID=573024 RepID=A0A1N7HK28_9RHOB|nr:glutamine amidotransferase [Roseovarius nanhaiticus]SEL24751.1 GMP synthase (glutamine-hydrolysing) [Roseovarius nanhaiticus]SIS25226.1 GMP synthase (glutamine-hydrolysing) [Roseovarius nanhaiticus]
MKRFLILQLRPERDASDAEYASFLQAGGLEADRTHRIRLDAEPLPEALDPAEYAGVIVGGGPGCVSDAPGEKSSDHARIEAAVLSLIPRVDAGDVPFLGCCYGIGILGAHLGAPVGKGRYGEAVGTADCTLTEAGRADPLLDGMPDRFDAFVGHKEALEALPKGSAHLVSGPNCPYQMVRYRQNIYATQFHPEADASAFEQRIGIYRHHGYFPPDQADALIAMCRASNVTAPRRIIANFVRRYG